MTDISENFQIRQHSNGTHTLVDLANNQSMHSRIGPAEESKLVYAQPSRIESRLSNPTAEVVLYDVGMGTAANVLAVFDLISSSRNSSGTLRIFSFEEKPEGLCEALRHLDLFPVLRPWNAQLRDLLLQIKKPGSPLRFRIGDVFIEWHLWIGDFYIRLSDAPPPDFIFFDLYSPKNVSELWSYACFRKIREHLGDHPTVLITYSVATPVRLHLLAAGFYVGSGSRTSVKNETTVASTRLNLLEFPLSKGWLEKLESSASISDQSFRHAKSAALKNPQWIENSK